MSKKKKETNPFTEAFKKLPPNATPNQVEQVIKEILIKNGLNVSSIEVVNKMR